MVEPSSGRKRANSIGEAPRNDAKWAHALYGSATTSYTDHHHYESEETAPTSPFRQIKEDRDAYCGRLEESMGELEDTTWSDEKDTSSRSVEDPYTYSDDSASLSDAYFGPQQNDEHQPPPYYPKPPPNGLWAMPPPATQEQLQQLYPLAHHYGSTQYPVPFAGAAIQEDSDQITSTEASRLLPPPSIHKPHTKRKTTRGGRRNNHPNRPHHHHHIVRQRETSSRRSSSRHSSLSSQQRKYYIWAFLFLAHFLTILVFAIRFGYLLLFEQPPSGYHFWNVPWYEDNDSHMLHNSTMTTTHPANGLETAVWNLSTFTIDYQNAMALVSITLFYSCVVVYVSFGFMLLLARALIQIMLVVSVILALCWGVVGLTVDPYGIISVSGFCALLLALGYAMYSWSRIPFAATNLFTALSALRSTADITIVSLVSLVVSCIWCMIWGVAFIGIVNSLNHVECKHKDEQECETHLASHHIPIYLLLFASFHWTNTVIKNVTRVTIASVVATWWYYPGDVGTFCSPSVLKPLLLAVTKQFGSICFGSLVAQPAQFLIFFGKLCCCTLGSPQDSSCKSSSLSSPPPQPSCKTKQNELGATTMQDEEDAESPVDSVGLFRRICVLNDKLSIYLRSCNRWAYTFVGMYGYGFIEAGERAIHLFENRSWLDVIKDGLIHNVLVMASAVIGGSVGTFAVVVEETDGFELSSFHKPIISAFGIGCVFGYVLSNILLLGVIGSAVNTVLVCFALGPFEFDKNHPRLSQEMREMWSRQVWEPTVVV